MCYSLGQIRVSAQLLTKSDKDQGLNEAVYFWSHRAALLGQKNP